MNIHSSNVKAKFKTNDKNINDSTINQSISSIKVRPFCNYNIPKWLGLFCADCLLLFLEAGG